MGIALRGREQVEAASSMLSVQPLLCPTAGRGPEGTHPEGSGTRGGVSAIWETRHLHGTRSGQERAHSNTLIHSPSRAHLSLPWAEAKEKPSPPSITWPAGIHGLPLCPSGSPTSQSQSQPLLERAGRPSHLTYIISCDPHNHPGRKEKDTVSPI